MKTHAKQSYRMSPNELERFLQQEKEKNRKFRIQQVSTRYIFAELDKWDSHYLVYKKT